MAYRKERGRPLLFKSAAILQKKIDGYFAFCKENDKPYTITGLAVYLNTSRETLLNYQKKDSYFDTIKSAKEFIHSWTEEQLYRNTQVTGAIFSLKNNYGWKDQQDHEINITGLDKVARRMTEANNRMDPEDPPND